MKTCWKTSHDDGTHSCDNESATSQDGRQAWKRRWVAGALDREMVQHQEVGLGWLGSLQKNVLYVQRLSRDRTEVLAKLYGLDPGGQVVEGWPRKETSCHGTTTSACSSSKSAGASGMASRDETAWRAQSSQLLYTWDMLVDCRPSPKCRGSV